MRARLLLLAGLVGVVGAIVPATPAAAICIYPYQLVTGHCSPCTTGAIVWREAEAATGADLPGEAVLFTCIA